MTTVPEEAVKAAKDVLYYANPNDVERALTAAAPHLAAERVNSDQIEAARKAVEELAHVQMNLPLEDWSRISSAILSALEPSAARKLALEEAHADDVAVDRFAVAMKEKLAKKRAEGRGGWENKDECSAEYLSYLLIQHIWKGDPVDIANLAMMLQQRGERVVIDSETSSIIPDHADAGKVEGDGWLPTHRHRKRGTYYSLIGIGKMQADNWQVSREGFDQSIDMEEVAIYRSVDDGSLWVRPREEFEDGRFETIPTPPSGEVA